MQHTKKIIILLLIAWPLGIFSQDKDSLNFILSRSKDELARAGAYIALSDVCDPEDIEKNAKRGLQLIEKLIENRDRNDKDLLLKLKAKAVNNIGLAFQYKGDLERARRYFISSGKIHGSINDRSGMAASLSNIGFTYHMQGLIPKAIEYYSKALNIQEELNNKSGAAVSYANLADIYRAENETKKAIEFYEKSLQIGKDLDLTKITSHALSALSESTYQLGDTVNALKYLNDAILLQEKTLDHQGLVNSLCIKGVIYIEIHDYPDAKLCFERALNLCIKHNNTYGLALVNENIAILNFHLNNFAVAKKFGLDALKIAENIGVPQLKRDASEIMSKICAATQDYSGAFNYYKQFIFFKDSIANEGTRKKALRNSLNAEFEKKEMVIKEKQAIERTKAEEKNRSQLKIIYITIFSLIIVGCFLIFLIRSLKQNKKINKVIVKQNALLESKNSIIEEKQKELMDSINYAKRIQYSLLAHSDFLNSNLPEHFIYFNPKDIVSGDFYWATSADNKFYLAVCDSTGHGVPGAFMSILNIGFLSEAINEEGIYAPNDVFNYVRQRLIDSVSKEGQKDGFDGILICFDNNTTKITFAAAHNEPLLVRDNKIFELGVDHMPVGMGENMNSFKLYTLDYIKGDLLYIYTDGYADQFGGPKGKKFKYKQLNELILLNSNKTLNEQSKILRENFEKWRGELEQIDDVCIIGIRL